MYFIIMNSIINDELMTFCENWIKFWSFRVWTQSRKYYACNFSPLNSNLIYWFAKAWHLPEDLGEKDWKKIEWRDSKVIKRYEHLHCSFQPPKSLKYKWQYSVDSRCPLTILEKIEIFLFLPSIGILQTVYQHLTNQMSH